MRKSIQRQGPMLASLMAALMLAGCAQFEIADRAVDYNLAVEDATNRMLLLNAVRASKRYPMHFTAITEINTTSPPKGIAAFTIPFGGDADSAFTFTPSLTVSSGTTFNLGVLNKELFIQGITTPIKMDTFDYYLDQGWPREMLFLMFVRRIELGEKDFGEIITTFNNTCEPKKRTEICERFHGLVSNPDLPHDCGPLVRGQRKFLNDPAGDKDSFCRFVEFQRLIRMLMALDLRIETVEKTKGGPELTERTTSTNTLGATTKVIKETDVQSRKVTTVKRVIPDLSRTTTTEKYVFKDKTTMKVFKYNNGKIGRHDVAKGDKKAIAFIRSPEAMVFYMGELIDTQIVSGDKFKPKIRQRRIDANSGKPSWKEVSLFRVRTGWSGGAAAVSVAHEGETYYIPRDKDERGRSMHVLSLVSQIFALHQSSKELTGTTSVRVIGD